MNYNDVISFIKKLYDTKDRVFLHEPVFWGNEKKYLGDCIDSTFVSSVGKYVDQLESMLKDFTGAKKAIVVSNGTSALHAALNIIGVKNNDEVITQALTFVATCNAISLSGASPVFVDVDRDTMGMSPESLENFLNDNCEIKEGISYNKKSGKRISSCVPMHTFGNPLRIKEVVEVCNKWNIPVVEDAAESLGSYVGETHTGLFGVLGVLSFNGNKTITTGGGGAIITNDVELGNKVKHITTTAKLPHKWEFKHDMVAFNYRMPNINAALGCAQFEVLNDILLIKKQIADKYKTFFEKYEYLDFVDVIPGAKSNYWLNAVIAKDRDERDKFLASTNDAGVMTRPIWTLMNKLEMYKNCCKSELTNSEWLEDRVVNVPSGAIKSLIK